MLIVHSELPQLETSMPELTLRDQHSASLTTNNQWINNKHVVCNQLFLPFIPLLTYLRSHYRQPGTCNASNTLVTSQRIFSIHFSTRFIIHARIGFVQRMFSTRALRRGTLKAIYVHSYIVVRDIINFIQKIHIDNKKDLIPLKTDHLQEHMYLLVSQDPLRAFAFLLAFV